MIRKGNIYHWTGCGSEKIGIEVSLYTGPWPNIDEEQQSYIDARRLQIPIRAAGLCRDSTGAF